MTFFHRIYFRILTLSVNLSKLTIISELHFCFWVMHCLLKVVKLWNLTCEEEALIGRLIHLKHDESWERERKGGFCIGVCEGTVLFMKAFGSIRWGPQSHYIYQWIGLGDQTPPPHLITLSFLFCTFFLPLSP